MAKIANDENALIAEIRNVKMLLVLQLLRSGVKQSQIAATLGISEATMSRMLPKGMGKNVAKKQGAGVSDEDS
jgi:DNA-binding transcriptional regulator LsrR (DeoR family)